MNIDKSDAYDIMKDYIEGNEIERENYPFSIDTDKIEKWCKNAYKAWFNTVPAKQEMEFLVTEAKWILGVN